MKKNLSAAAGLVLALLAATTAAAQERSDRSVLGRAPGRAVAEPISAEQRQLLAEKLAIVDALMRSAGSNPETSADHRIWLLESMYRLPVSELRGMASPASHEALVRAVTKASKTRAKLGAANNELVYYPITPCRYIDTRNIGGPLVAATPRGYDLANTGTPYGGSGACDPKAAVGGNEDTIGALAMNVTIISPTTAPGFVAARPAGSTQVTSLVNWYQVGASVQAANAGVVPTNQTPATVNEIEFVGSPTQFIVDVFGVFAAPTATPLDCTNGTETSVVVTTASRNFNLAADACPASYAMVSNSCQASGDYSNGAVVLAGGGTGFGISTPYASNCVGTYTGSGAGATIYNAPWCCRIPGR
jgi:hypothetical protein